MDLNILLADDSKFFRTIERQFLQKTPAQVHEASDSDDLFAQLAAAKPQLLFLAYALRPLDGAECCRKIKANPALRQMPVVIICDQDAPGQLDAARSAGCDEILVKPLDRHRFLQAGRKFLSGIREHRQPCFLPVSFEWQGEVHKGKTLDISNGGAFIENKIDIPPGTMVKFTFTFPETGKTDSCQGEIAWLNRRPNMYKPHYPLGFGVKFKDLPPHLADTFSRLALR